MNTTYKLQMRVDSTNHQSIDFVSDANAREHIDILTGNQVFNTRFTYDGKVGIGTTSPGQKLDVSGNILGNNFYANDSSVPSLYMERGDGLAQPVIRLVKSNDNLLIGHTAIDEVIFYDDAGEAMRLDGSGNLGIGTTSPGARLHVTDSIRIDTGGAGPSAAPTTGTPTQAQVRTGGDETYYLSEPDTWLGVNIGGTDYVIPAYEA
jgi:hypothetical protein